MNKRIAIYAVGYGGKKFKMKSVLIEEINRILKLNGCETLLFYGDESDMWMRSYNHYQVYENFLNFCELENVDIALFMEELVNAGVLLAELKARPYFKPKIVFHSNLREPHRSKARMMVFKELLEMKQVKKAFFYSLIGKYAVPPDNWIAINPDRNKYEMIGEPNVTSQYKELIEDVKNDDNRALFNLPHDKKIGLFFGRNVPTKGIDLLIKSLDHLDPNIHIFIVTHDLSGQTDNNIEEIRKQSNVTLLHEVVPEELVARIFSASDFVILPYKKQYEYGGSGVIKIAVAAKIPVVVSNIYPFNEAVSLFSLGEAYGTGSEIALARAINLVAKNNVEFINNAKFDKFEEVFSMHFDMAQRIIKCLE